MVRRSGRPQVHSATHKCHTAFKIPDLPSVSLTMAINALQCFQYVSLSHPATNTVSKKLCCFSSRFILTLQKNKTSESKQKEAEGTVGNYFLDKGEVGLFCSFYHWQSCCDATGRGQRMCGLMTNKIRAI